MAQDASQYQRPRSQTHRLPMAPDPNEPALRPRRAAASGSQRSVDRPCQGIGGIALGQTHESLFDRGLAQILTDSWTRVCPAKVAHSVSNRAFEMPKGNPATVFGTRFGWGLTALPGDSALGGLGRIAPRHQALWTPPPARAWLAGPTVTTT